MPKSEALSKEEKNGMLSEQKRNANHPDGRTFSEGDIKSFLKNNDYKIMVAVGHNGKVYVLEKYEGFDSAAAMEFFEFAKDQCPNRTDSAEIYVSWMEEYVIKGVEQYGASYFSR